jgi:hypothetical protein
MDAFYSFCDCTSSRFPSSIRKLRILMFDEKNSSSITKNFDENWIAISSTKKMTAKPKSTCIVYWNSTDLTSTNFWHMIIYSIHYFPGNVNKVNNNSSHLHNSPSRHLNPFGSRKACTDNPRLGLAEHMVGNFHNCLVEKRYLPTYQVVRISICSIHTL